MKTCIGVDVIYIHYTVHKLKLINEFELRESW